MRVPALKPSQLPGPKRKPGVNEPLVNFTKVPNNLDVLISDNKLSGYTQVKIIWVLIRATWGSEKRPEWASLSLKQLADLCGGIEPSTISSELKDLSQRKIIECQSGKGCTDTKRYKVTPEHWREAEPYAKRETPAESKPIDSKSDKLILRPGGAARPVPARLTLENGDPVDFQIAFTSSCEHSLIVSHAVRSNLLSVHLDAAKKRNKSEELLYSESSQKAKTDGNNRLTEYEFCIKSLLTLQFEKPFDTGVPADRKFLKKIIESAGDDLPAAEFEAYCKGELHAMVRRRKQIYPGILIPFAEQAARKFASAQCNFAPDSPTAPTGPPQLSPEEIEALSYCVRCNDTGNDGTWDHGKFSPCVKPFRTCPACEGKRRPGARGATV